jgi:hypothetical protein
VRQTIDRPRIELGVLRDPGGYIRIVLRVLMLAATLHFSK